MTAKTESRVASARSQPPSSEIRTAAQPAASPKNAAHHAERENPQNPSHAVDATQTADAYTVPPCPFWWVSLHSVGPSGGPDPLHRTDEFCRLTPALIPQGSVWVDIEVIGDESRPSASAPMRVKDATQIALGLYVAYNVAATVASLPAGRIADRLAARGPELILLAGVILTSVAYAGLALDTTSIVWLCLPFIVAGVAVGCVETAEHSAVAALAPSTLRGSAFGMLAAIQAIGNFAASTVAGLLWTLASPTIAFGYLAAWMVLATLALSRLVLRPGVPQ